MIRVLVWNEFRHEKTEENVKAIYPNGIHNAIADFLRSDDISVRTATLDDENCGITEEILRETDVIIWWGHCYHGAVPDEVAAMVRDAVHAGMGAIFLHSAHHSKPFRFLMGTPCSLCWRETGGSENLWVIEPSHPIVQGVGRVLTLPHEETYGEPFSIPSPDKLLMIGSYSGGEVFRSACLFDRGNGKIFYFQPGHETFPTYYIPEVQTILRNAVRFVAPVIREPITCPHVRLLSEGGDYVIS